QSSLQEVIKFHNAILLDLFENEQHPVFKKISNLFNELTAFLDRNKSPDYNFVYDQVIGFGELVSTTIVSEYLNEVGLINKWLDVRDFIKTDNYYRNERQKWKPSQKQIATEYNRIQLNNNQVYL